MEESCSVSKRKKRKTRRCLDELRKKSLRTVNSTNKNNEHGSKVNSNMPKVLEINPTTYITSNRLTLAIYPKAVRSETITRPLLAEIRHEPGNININNVVKSNHAPDEIVSEEIEEDDVQSNEKNNNSSILFSLDEDSVDNADEDRAERDDIILKLESPAIAGSDDGPPSPAPRTPLPRDPDAYRVYEQFVKNIPKYIQMHAPSLLEEDAAKKPIEILRNMYLESHRKVCDSEKLDEPETETPDDCPEYPALCEPRAAPFSPSPSPSPSPQLSRSRIRDTPDYTYFPHKLNE